MVVVVDDRSGERRGEGAQRATVEFLLRRMRYKGDFPALSDSVSAINKLTHSDKESINRLSNTIIKDYGLTNKILRIANSAYFTQAGAGNISTVSRAVIVLGFDAVRNIVINVLLFEHMQDKVGARELREAFLKANLAALLARDAGQKFMGREAEEAFICALFHSLGRLLSLHYFSEEMAAIRAMMQQKQVDEDVASENVLGVSFHDLGIAVAQEWGFPHAIVHSMRRLEAGQVNKPETQGDILRTLSGFANQLCDSLAAGTPDDHDRIVRELTERFGAGMGFTECDLRPLVEKSLDELGQLANSLRVNLNQSHFARQVRLFAGVGTPAVAGDGAAGRDNPLSGALLGDSFVASNGSGNDEEGSTEEVLTAGIHDISNSLVEDASLNDILRIILETMYRAVGFKRVILCMRDPKAGRMVARFGFGPDTMAVVKQFDFPLAVAADVFSLSVTKGVDILISDVDAPGVASQIPSWFREKVPAKTFALFPLTLKGMPVALIYCDKEVAGSIFISERESQLLKTLRNQAVLAIKQTR